MVHPRETRICHVWHSLTRDGFGTWRFDVIKQMTCVGSGSQFEPNVE